MKGNLLKTKLASIAHILRRRRVVDGEVGAVLRTGEGRRGEHLAVIVWGRGRRGDLMGGRHIARASRAIRVGIYLEERSM